jgi:hypothetical protein
LVFNSRIGLEMPAEWGYYDSYSASGLSQVGDQRRTFGVICHSIEDHLVPRHELVPRLRANRFYCNHDIIATVLHQTKFVISLLCESTNPLPSSLTRR